MLEKLDLIEWEDLKHAYGAAGDVPEDLRNLASLDKATREKALFNLYGTIFHQGSRYEATPYAIPFLFELIQEESVKDKEKIILLLVNLALGYEEEFLPEGIDIHKYRKDLLESEAKVTEQNRIEYKKFGYSAQALIDCYNFVRDEIPTLHSYLTDSEYELRDAIIYALAWFPELAKKSIFEISQQLKVLKEEKAISNALLSIGLLAKQTDEKIDLSFLRVYLSYDSKLVRTCTAIALAKMPLEEEVLNTLIESIQSSKELDYVEGMFFNESQIAGYASKVLSTYAKSEKERILPILCQVLEKVNPYQALDITRSMLSIINSDRESYIMDDSLEDLSSIEIQVLNSIYEHGGWKIGKGGFANYYELLRSMGVPHSKEALGEFLQKDSNSNKTTTETPNPSKNIFSALKRFFKKQ